MATHTVGQKTDAKQSFKNVNRRIDFETNERFRIKTIKDKNEGCKSGIKKGARGNRAKPD